MLEGKCFYGRMIFVDHCNLKNYPNRAFNIMSNKLGKNQTKAILISGYAWSGSGAVVDLLKEFKNYSPFEPEFRLITDPGGLLDLEHALITSKSYTTINYVLKRFKFLTKIYARNFHWRDNFKIYKAFQKIGFNYNKYMDLNFEQLSNSYIDDLIDLKYYGDLITSYYDLNHLSFFLLKARFFIMRLLDKKNTKSEKIYFSNINKDSFIAKTREYTDKIIEFLKKGEEIPVEYQKDLFTLTKKKEYELVYAGKKREEKILNDTMSVPFQVVKHFGETKKNEWSNMLIFGDNLQSLKHLLKLKEEGKSYREIAAEEKVSIGKISQILSVHKSSEKKDT